METILPVKSEYLNISKEDKLKLTEQSFSDYKDGRDEMFALTDEFDKELEKALSLTDTEAVEKIFEIVNSQKYLEGLQYRQYRYQHFVKFVNVLLYEKQYGNGYSISAFKSMEDVIEIYQQIVILLRRIEFDLEIREQLEIFIYLAENRLSYFHLLAAVQFGTIYHKSKVYRKLSEYMGMKGEENWKQFFYEWDRTHESK